MDRERGWKAVRRAELLARLDLLDRVISEHAVRTASVRERGWDVTAFEEQAKLYQATRKHDVALLRELLFDDKLPELWTELDVDVPAESDAGHRKAR